MKMHHPKKDVRIDLGTPLPMVLKSIDTWQSEDRNLEQSLSHIKVLRVSVIYSTHFNCFL